MVDDKARRLPVSLARHYGRNPFRIARMLGIYVMERTDFKRQKGAFKIVLGNAFIFLNANLSEEMQRIVCAHELGHALLHRSLGKDGVGLMEFGLFDQQSQTEYEANIFAANLLLDEGQIREHLKEGLDLASLARTLETHVNLLLLKLREMKDIDLSAFSMQPARNFLGQISDDAGSL